MSSPIDLTLHDDGEDVERCPVCAALVPLVQLPDHCEAHFIQPEAAANDGTDGTVVCAVCAATLALAEYDSHLLAHELEGQEVEGEQVAAALEDEEELSTRQAEELYFKQLRAKYGFEDAVSCRRELGQLLPATAW